jgi:hypothetical protein
MRNAWSNLICNSSFEFLLRKPQKNTAMPKPQIDITSASKEAIEAVLREFGVLGTGLESFSKVC